MLRDNKSYNNKTKKYFFYSKDTIRMKNRHDTELEKIFVPCTTNEEACIQNL